uniref:LOW QUALITY PROTEIN: probable ATP-dependent RNA helicase DHX37 n=1 Tax=Styela clava TaxID=7725 RepID=UPI001939334B|nr:LOW QUALITY PROTEIN: probable ATP-dependent RNA helicase DHX37 [Styela clava]
MGRARRKYGRPVESQRPASSVKTESLELSNSTYAIGNQESNSNMIILDSRKEKTGKPQVSHQPKPKKLSKKERKKLRKIVDQKAKKAKRAELLEELSKVQVNSSELALMSSVAHLGTKNSHLQLSKRPLPDELREEVEKLNSIRGSKRQKRNRAKKKEDIELIKEDSTDTSDISLTSEDEEKEDGKNYESDEVSKVETETEHIESQETENIQMKDKPEKANLNTDSLPVSQTIDTENPTTGKLNVSNTPLLSAFPSDYVSLDREASVQESRLKLPILAEEQSIMEAIRHNHTVVLCGETGSGKTTQVPQFLYEAGYAKHGMIGVTEPRRVAAISMSRRVATEMNLSTNNVSYQIRYEGNVTPSTEIKFMTDGVLLREVQEDFLLSRYSAIIIDEAHERSVYTDVLIGLLSRIVPLRNKKGKPMRLIIMSATLRVEDFTQNVKLFKTPPPVIRVETRQFPVTVHFNKKTPVEGPTGGRPYIREAFKKICKVHRTLPSGGILVFVTGQNEVHSLSKLLRTTFPSGKPDGSISKVINEPKKESDDTKNKDEEEVATDDSTSKEKCLPEVNLEKYSSLPEEKEEETDEQEDRDAPAGYSDDDDLESDDEIMDNPDFLKEVDQSLPLHVLPLYSLLATSKQQNVFKPPPENTRLCVVATNVAETSLTIPGIKYVIDTGKVKKRVYDKVTGISSFQITWVSKASADQRAGRAGRVGPGHAYRLYSSAVFQDFINFSAPEIASKPVPGLVLQMKQMNIERVVNFPFPTPPGIESLKSAEDLLISLGAVEKPKPTNIRDKKQARFGGPITSLGKSMAMFPVHPRFGKMLATASAKDHKELLPYVITLVAALTVREIFAESHEPPTSQEEKEKLRQGSCSSYPLKSVWSGGTNQSAKAFGDLMVLLGAVGSAEYTGLTPQLCNQNCLRYKALLEIRKLRAQLTNVINSVDTDSQLFLNSKMEPPDDLQIKLLRQIVLSAMGDHVAKKIPESQIKSNKDPKEVRRLTGAYSCLLTTEPVFIHPTSVMSQSSKLPEYVVYQEIIETNKSYMKDVMSIELEWLSMLNPQYCTFSSPLEEPSSYLNKDSGKIECYVNATYGRLSWPLGTVTIVHPPGLERYKWFARYMLEDIIKHLPRQFSCLLSKPEIMTKSWANLQPRTQTLLKALLREEVDENQKLISAWNKDKYYLLTEFQEWLPESIRDDLPSRWPPKF